MSNYPICSVISIRFGVFLVTPASVPMQLPYLKNKFPRVAKDEPGETLINASSDDHVEDHCIGELMEACEAKDAGRFRESLEALILNLFDWDGDDT